MIEKKKIVLCAIIIFSIFFLVSIFMCAGTSAVKENNQSVKTAEPVSHSKYLENKKIPDEIKALYKAYSTYIDEIKYVNDDWLITLRGVDLYWADGKLLPSDKKPYESKYRSYGFYKYSDDLPELITEPDEQMLERLKRYEEGRETLQRDNTFLETLYNGKNRKEIQNNFKVINFLGFRAEAHESVIEKYSAIDKEIKESASKNPEIKQFISSLGSISTFTWRDIENSKSKSYHSFGIAIDINPKKLGNKQIYWNWTANYNEKWYTVPYSQRWMVHPEIVKIFEKYGFVWGGKWVPFDNMHFEYRPEILILSGKDVAEI
jgi:hypothetical protein